MVLGQSGFEFGLAGKYLKCSGAQIVCAIEKIGVADPQSPEIRYHRQISGKKEKKNLCVLQGTITRVEKH